MSAHAPLDVPTSKGFNELPADKLALGDVTRGGNPNYLNERVPNPYENLLPGSSINSSTVPRQQLLRPFSQFTSFNQQDIPNGKSLVQLAAGCSQ